jgi:hypothetical protein
MEGADLIIAFDPGGERRFGCCVLRVNRFESGQQSHQRQESTRLARSGEPMPIQENKKREITSHFPNDLV